MSAIIKIKPVTHLDLQALSDICRKTFEESYAAFNTAENMRYYLENHFSLSKLEEEQNTKGSFFYLLYHADHISGYLKLNLGRNHLGIADKEQMEIERIYVLKNDQRKAFGQSLYLHTLKVATHHHIKTIWLGVWEFNHKAMAFYTKNGFKTIGTHIFKFGDEDQTDFIMELKLN